ncbi:MAG: hypothetical protein EOO99_02325 [Pedobacter sp.]|nr:MAG: hypothetical protein EOO99_02325 [Pedobacter sp.]
MKHKLCLFILFLSLAFTASHAQNWGGGVDESKLNWGFLFQYVSTQNQIRLANQYNLMPYPDVSKSNVNLAGIEPVASPGFAIGGLLSYRVDKLVDLRFTPSFTLTQRSFNYYFRGVQGNNDPPIPREQQLLVTKETPASLIELPLTMKLKSERVGNYRFYMLGGLKYAMSVNSASKLNNDLRNDLDKYVNYSRNYVSFDTGAGIDFYMNYFKMSAEIKYAKSIGSILKNEPSNVFSQALDKVYLRHVSVNLIFETTL